MVSLRDVLGGKRVVPTRIQHRRLGTQGIGPCASRQASAEARRPSPSRSFQALEVEVEAEERSGTWRRRRHRGHAGRTPERPQSIQCPRSGAR